MKIETYSKAICDLRKDFEVKISEIDSTITDLKELQERGNVVMVDVVKSRSIGKNPSCHICIETLISALLKSKKKFIKGIEKLDKKMENL